ncbi:unnamed protein product [Peronospora farinosa]|uniref:P-type ATPase C-terminal domain-containing protein n=1 Tax=Peronospora farinosa TaxID=134698 RepID=A0ABN8C5N1_9STRA|nr:unnamed protein product [Peronospora farinosa]
MYWEIGGQLYNIAFTGLPIIVVGVLDMDLSTPFSIEYLDLYRRGPDRFFFNMYTFFRWVAAAFYESLVIFVVILYGCNASDKAAGNESRVEFGTQTPYIATFTVRSVVNLYQCTFHPDLAQLLLETMGGAKYKHHLTINHVEEQTLSMSLDEVHATSYLTDFGLTDAEIVKAQHHEQQRNKSLSSNADTFTVSGNSGVQDSYSTSVYRDSMSEDGNSVPTKMFHPTTTNQRTLDYAFTMRNSTSS